MREMKFRAWDKENKIFHYFTLFDIWKNIKYPSHVITNHKVYPMKDLVIDQYTGLKDKDGKEICEGDILRIKTKNRHPKNLPDEELREWRVLIEEITSDYAFIRETVMWGRVGFRFTGFGSDDMKANTEIFGYFYENRELLPKTIEK